mgnify:FL=1|tara:strand:- start:1722 stop:1913 length:192 start_codon:yes stop_codon:yes gene_type:complete
MKNFKSFLYDDVLNDEEKHQIVENIEPETTEINIIKETPPVNTWGKKLSMTSCRNGHFTFSYI